MKRIKKIHFTGIKGVGMTPLAIIAKQAGFEVTGSDIGEEFITDEPLSMAEINYFSKFSPENINSPDLLITTGAHGGFDNPEVKEAISRNIRVWTQGQAVGEFMKGEIFDKSFSGVSVLGTHGKTTTCAMISTTAIESGLDPSYVIGTSNIKPIGLPGHYGRGKFFIAEADEYATEPIYDKTPKFLWQFPEIAVITNIELDHPDLFENIDELTDVFLKFTGNIKKNGALIIYGDQEGNKKVLKEYSGNKVTYGFSPANDFVIEKIRKESDGTFFWVSSRETSLGEFHLKIPGEFNAINALASIIAGIEMGLSVAKIKDALSKYKGSQRRYEYVGKLSSGALLYDDYAHHPTEIKETLKAFRESFKSKKIVCIFQPHTYSRTKTLFNDFADAFYFADEVIIMDIYSSLREEKDEEVSSDLLVKKMRVKHNSVLLLPDQASVIEYISKKSFGEEYVLITMGAGDVYKIREGLGLEK